MFFWIKQLSKSGEKYMQCVEMYIQKMRLIYYSKNANIHETGA